MILGMCEIFHGLHDCFVVLNSCGPHHGSHKDSEVGDIERSKRDGQLADRLWTDLPDKLCPHDDIEVAFGALFPVVSGQSPGQLACTKTAGLTQVNGNTLYRLIVEEHRRITHFQPEA